MNEEIKQKIRDIITLHENNIYIAWSLNNQDLDYDRIAESRMRTWEDLENLFLELWGNMQKKN